MLLFEEPSSLICRSGRNMTHSLLRKSTTHPAQVQIHARNTFPDLQLRFVYTQGALRTMFRSVFSMSAMPDMIIQLIVTHTTLSFPFFDMKAIMLPFSRKEVVPECHNVLTQSGSFFERT
ncbi:hypothetical protein CPB83DRAFT_261520 [Crepidotus variabilis]|uniref:Uncharacterized protein n=1 Tax=Crepidotus variabilis TaxID=179855 RepID=A0A9P6EIU6_9AGAR|nr:hypothetical protein CPB83DRAFT_261520 [Crepidotus variabilis]